MSKFDPDKHQDVPSGSVTRGGAVNPSSPTSGTEGYGSEPGEPTNFSGPGPTASYPGTQGAGDVRKSSYPMAEGSSQMENKSRAEELRDNPNNRMGKEFRCADVGNMNCNWSVTGMHEDEILRRAEEHGREAHGMSDIDEKTRNHIRGAIRDRAA